MRCVFALIVPVETGILLAQGPAPVEAKITKDRTRGRTTATTTIFERKDDTDQRHPKRFICRLSRTGEILVAMGRKRTRRTFLTALGSGAISLSGCTAPNIDGSEQELDLDQVEQDKLVGAHYYLWYWGSRGYGANQGRGWTDHSPYMPELGQYDSRDPDIINQHIKWALENGVNWFIHTTGPPGHDVDRAIRDTYLEAELADRMTWSLQTGFDHDQFERDEAGMIPLDTPHNQEQIQRFLEHYEEHYFDTPGYLRFDGRPVLFDFSTPLLTGDIAGAFEEAKDAVSADPYLVGNPRAFWVPPTPPIDDLYDSLKQTIEAYDAVHKYAPLPPSGANERRSNYVEHWKEQTENWLFIARYHDTGFIPTVMPGYNDTEIKWAGRTHHEVLDLSPKEFADLCGTAPDYADPDLNAVIITSWNEFPEGTTIEPTNEYGMDRLETVRRRLGQQPASSVATSDLPLIEFSFDHTVTLEGSGPMDVAFRVEEMDLLAEDEAVRSYDIGTPGDEPYFAAGAYGPTGNGQETGRWLGGPEAHTALYFHENAINATTAIMTGYPIEPGITADIYRDGERSDQITFDWRGVQTYTISLREGL